MLQFQISETPMDVFTGGCHLSLSISPHMSGTSFLKASWRTSRDLRGRGPVSFVRKAQSKTTWSLNCHKAGNSRLRLPTALYVPRWDA